MDRPFCKSSAARNDAVRPRPSQAVLGAAAWPVLAADEACVAKSVEGRENFRIIDLAFIRLLARRNAGDLHMADERQVCFEAPDEIAAEDLCVIKIELNAQIGAADLGDDIGGLLDAIEEIAGRSRGLSGSIRRVILAVSASAAAFARFPDEDRLGRRTLLGWDTAGHAMNGAAANRHRVIKGARKACLPLALAAWNSGETGLTLTAERRIDAKRRQVMPSQLRLHG